MPRPGPRPYECARRAWHSERHQPMRGSIIQQIFRVVTEAHLTATKKNKEWQEKLPVVVLKAEEIIYSKANSEAEYLNLDTLCDRLSDAINIIIRRDQTTETGELLPPCVEAALNLGCKPVRTSRSDRHNNPTTYLSPRTPQHPGSVSSKSVGCNPSNLAKFTSTIFALPVLGSDHHTHQNNRLMGSCNYLLSDSLAALQHHQPLALETNPSLNLGSVYPLYYGYEAIEPVLRTNNKGNTCSDTVFAGRPVISPALEPSAMHLFENFSYGRVHHVPNTIVKENAASIQEESQDRECDLSLRLGQCLHACSSSKTSSAYESEDVGLGVSKEGSKFGHSSLQRNREFCFYPGGTGYGNIYSTSQKCNVEGNDDQNILATFQKP